MATITARVDDWLKAEIESFWRTHGEGPSSGLRRVAEEWWALQQFPSLGFRDGVAGRRAWIRGGPDVWEVVLVARDYGEDREGLHDHFAPHVPPDAIDQALAYAGRFPNAVDALIDQNTRLERIIAQGH